MSAVWIDGLLFEKGVAKFAQINWQKLNCKLTEWVKV